MIGKTLGHYQITEKLGEGGMGVVYKARDTHLDRFAALKVLPPEKVSDPDRKRRFIQEAKAASALNHPNIITIHDIDQADGIDFIAMEYVAGKTLDELIPRKGMRLSLALKYAIQIADALARAHGAGIIHRDLKPSNVMVDEHGLVKVLDFGLAKLTETAGPEAETAATRTGSGTILGTAAYMSPEQAEGKHIDTRSDIFSFGSMLYEMLTGQRAFRGDTRASTIASILREDPKPISQVSEGLPRDAEKIVRRCLRKDPEHRFHHMEDLRVALEELKEESDSGALETADGVKPRPRRKFIWAFGIAAALVIATVGVWFVRSRVGTQEAPLTPVPLTSYAGSEYGASFSPDGTQIAFGWNGEKEDNWDIYIKLVGSEPPFRLTTNKADEGWPAWSPDGRQIAFLRNLGAGKGAVVLISPLGGPERILTECHFSEAEVVTGPFLSWTPDSRALAIVERASVEILPSLTLCMVETAEKYSLTKTTKDFPADSCPAFSPHGRTLAFSRRADLNIGDLYLLNLSRDLKPVGEPRRLTFQSLPIIGSAWVSDGSALVYSAGGSLWRVAAVGSAQPQKLASIGQDADSPAISHRASRLAYTHSTSDNNIWRIEIFSSQGKANPPMKFISSTRYEGTPRYSPDGKKISFSSDRSGTEELWICDADGSNPIQLTHFGKGFVSDQQWSPDSSRLTFPSGAEGHAEVYVINASGGKPRRLTFSAGSTDPSWSKDGQWIYFTSVDTTRIYKIPAEGGAAVPVNGNLSGWDPTESVDGRFIYFFINGPNPSLWRATAKGEEPRKVLESLSSSIQCAFEDDGIYFLPGPGLDNSYAICFYELATGKIKTVAVLGKQPCMMLTVSPDRRWALYTQQDQSGSDLMLVENFR
jgi:serine/threonine protein kinase/Tol biopolymer transport system component